MKWSRWGRKNERVAFKKPPFHPLAAGEWLICFWWIGGSTRPKYEWQNQRNVALNYSVLEGVHLQLLKAELLRK